MPFISRMLSFWRNLFRKHQIEEDLNDELQAYIEELADRKVLGGLPPDAARDAALSELGGMERIKHLVRQQRIGFGGFRSIPIVVAAAVVAFIGGVLFASTKATSQSVATILPDTRIASKKAAVVLEGRLVDGATGRPIPNVELGLEPAPTSRRFTHTDDDGRFTFSNPPSQGYQLTAGRQKWGVGGIEVVGPPSNSMSNDRFLLSIPTSMTVLTRDGKRQEGEPLPGLAGIVFTNKKSSMAELRQFSYSKSVIELRAENLKTAFFSLGAAYYNASTAPLTPVDQ